MSSACGSADDYESNESIGAIAQAHTWVKPTNVSFASVPSWPYQTIVDFFNFARDVRWLKMNGNPYFKRRVSWLYPDGGCEARAEIIAYRAGISLLPKPYKIFVVNDLMLYTNNHPNGSVNWGHHVAPVVRSSSSGRPYVLDPSVDPRSPLRWTTWFQLLNSKSITLVAVEDPSNYSPFEGVTGDINTALGEMKYNFLQREWDRQVELGRDPNQVLDDSPPW